MPKNFYNMSIEEGFFNSFDEELVEVSILDVMKEPTVNDLMLQEEDVVDIQEKISQQKRLLNFNAAFVRYQVKKQNRGKETSPIILKNNKATCICPCCAKKVDKLFSELKDVFSKDKRIMTIKAFLNLYSYVGFCSCGEVVYGNLKEENLENIENPVFQFESKPETFSNLVSAEPNSMVQTETVIEVSNSKEEIPQPSVPQIIEESFFDKLNKMSHKELVFLAKGNIPNFRRMTKDELVIALGHPDDNVRSKMIEEVRVRTKKTYGSLAEIKTIPTQTAIKEVPAYGGIQLCFV